jgi:hypothetical protein
VKWGKEGKKPVKDGIMEQNSKCRQLQYNPAGEQWRTIQTQLLLSHPSQGALIPSSFLPEGCSGDIFCESHRPGVSPWGGPDAGSAPSAKDIGQGEVGYVLPRLTWLWCRFLTSKSPCELKKKLLWNIRFGQTHQSHSLSLDVSLGTWSVPRDSMIILIFTWLWQGGETNVAHCG